MINLADLCLAQDRNQLDSLPQEWVAPFAKDLQRRARAITKKKIRLQFGAGKYWPAGSHRNCGKNGISPKLYARTQAKAAGDRERSRISSSAFSSPRRLSVLARPYSSRSPCLKGPCLWW